MTKTVDIHVTAEPGQTVNLYTDTPDGKPIGSRVTGTTKARNRRTLAMDGTYVEPPVDPPPTSGTYGPGITCDTLFNAQVGGPASGASNTSVAFRFVAEHTGPTKAVRWYTIGKTHSGYGGGTGGTIRVTLQGDANGYPSGQVLASRDIVNPPDDFALYSWPNLSLSLAAGTPYHIVFENIDPNPKANYVSVDSCFAFGPKVTMPAQYRQSAKYGSGSWETRDNFVPILALVYADDYVQSQGYIEFAPETYGSISGTKQVRETFTVPQDRLLGDVTVRVRRVSGNDPLSVTVSGLAVGSIPASNIPQSSPGSDNGGAVTVTVPGSVLRPMMKAGAPHSLVLTTPSSSLYTVIPMRKGVDYGFPDPFPGGKAEQTSDGTTWKAAGRSGWHGACDWPFWLEAA